MIYDGVKSLKTWRGRVGRFNFPFMLLREKKLRRQEVHADYVARQLRETSYECFSSCDK